MHVYVEPLQHVSLTIKTSLGIFVGNGGSWLREDKAANIFELLFSPTGLVQSYIYVTQTLIGDAFMVRYFTGARIGMRG